MCWITSRESKAKACLDEIAAAGLERATRPLFVGSDTYQGPRTQADESGYVARLKQVFGYMDLEDMEPQYIYESSLVAAHIISPLQHHPPWAH